MKETITDPPARDLKKPWLIVIYTYILLPELTVGQALYQDWFGRYPIGIGKG